MPEATADLKNNQPVYLEKEEEDLVTNTAGHLNEAGIPTDPKTMIPGAAQTPTLAQSKILSQPTELADEPQKVVEAPSYEESRITKVVKDWLQLNTQGTGKGKPYFETKLQSALEKNQHLVEEDKPKAA